MQYLKLFFYIEKLIQWQISQKACKKQTLDDMAYQKMKSNRDVLYFFEAAKISIIS